MSNQTYSMNKLCLNKYLGEVNLQEKFGIISVKKKQCPNKLIKHCKWVLELQLQIKNLIFFRKISLQDDEKIFNKSIKEVKVIKGSFKLKKVLQQSNCIYLKPHKKINRKPIYLIAIQKKSLMIQDNLKYIALLNQLPEKQKDCII